MSLNSGSPTYLVKNPYSFCFRMKVPSDLPSILSKKVFCYSLKTGNLSAAKTKARFLAGNVQLLFREIRNLRAKSKLLTSSLKKIWKSFSAALL